MDIALMFELSNPSQEAYNAVFAQLQPMGYMTAWNNGTIIRDNLHIDIFIIFGRK